MKTSAEIKEIAADIFKRYPSEERVFVTGDGQAFFSEAQAKNHSRNNRTKKELAVYKFLRAEQETRVPTVAELKAMVSGMQTIEGVEEIKTEESAYGNRKGVLEACDKRISELKSRE